VTDLTTTTQGKVRREWKTLGDAMSMLEPGTDRVALILYSVGLLEGAEVWHRDNGLAAPFTWPTKQIALLVHHPATTPEERLSLAAEEDAFYIDACHKALQDEGWLVLRIDPDSPTVDEQLAQIALLVTHTKPCCDRSGHLKRS
jgi:hypothetical protein